ncbi:hypothetical protein [Enterobacter sp. 22325]|uniref:hypothetical protein n=1 Tax=Enterobacter sp. 22325 TaxID=3453911 RepID=UPI003F856E4A
MLLNKLLSILCIILASGCQGYNYYTDDKNDYVVVNFNKKVDGRILQRLEQIMIVEMPYGFTDVAIYTDSKNSNEASKLKNYFFKQYGVSSSIFQKDSNEVVYVQFKKYQPEHCYTYELNDFNWYRSSSNSIEEYSRAEVCATSFNDNTLKA